MEIWKSGRKLRRTVILYSWSIKFCHFCQKKSIFIIDATFFSSSSEFQQTLVIMCIVPNLNGGDDVQVPLLTAFMKNKKAETYMGIYTFLLNKIKEVTEMKLEHILVVTDDELSLHREFSDLFSSEFNVIVRLCQFHFSKTVRSWITKNGFEALINYTNKNNEKFNHDFFIQFRMVQNLSLLPVSMIVPFLEYLKNDKITKDLKIEEFYNYLIKKCSNVLFLNRLSWYEHLRENGCTYYDLTRPRIKNTKNTYSTHSQTVTKNVKKA